MLESTSNKLKFLKKIKNRPEHRNRKENNNSK